LELVTVAESGAMPGTKLAASVWLGAAYTLMTMLSGGYCVVTV
jgi:hypothetical protein